VSAEGGDHRAFLDATLRYLDVVYQVAWQAAADRQGAEDLVQATCGRMPHGADTAAAVCVRGCLGSAG
jgi:DNA-directed RNA polymerase specialized sigma24 family protein